MRFATIPQTNEALRILASPTSPLRGLVRVVADNTTLVQTASSSAPAGVIGQATQSFKDRFGNLLKPTIQQVTGAATVETGTAVTVHFQWARQLSAGDPGKTPLDGIIHTIGEIQQQLDTLGADVAGGSPVTILGSPQFRALMQTLQQQSATLPLGLPIWCRGSSRRPAGPWSAAPPRRSRTSDVDLVQPPCRTAIAGKYPFANSAVDVQPGDFGAVFGFDGVFDKFFSEHLAKQVDTSGQTWTWRPGAITPSHDLLPQFQAAQQLRDMFFQPGSRRPR